MDEIVAALGSDVMDVEQAGYGMLKLFGDQNGLEDVRKEVGYRYARSRRKSATSAE